MECDYCQQQRLAFVCGRCQTASYCTKECQQADWRSHQLVCADFGEKAWRTAHKLKSPARYYYERTRRKYDKIVQANKRNQNKLVRQEIKQLEKMLREVNTKAERDLAGKLPYVRDLLYELLDNLGKGKTPDWTYYQTRYEAEIE